MRLIFRRAVCLILCGLLSYTPAVFAGEKGVTVSPILSMPPVSYEGHTEVISDRSVYSVDGVSYTAKSAVEEGIVSSSFIPLQDDGLSISDGDIVSERKVTFIDPGVYTVELVLDVFDGSTYTARDSTHVQETPSVESVLTGAQKQNRKQSLDFRVASNPQYPVQDITVTVENTATGEKVDIDVMSGGKYLLKGTSTDDIKVGNISCESVENGCFYTGRVDFLTKYSEAQEMKYTVFSRDVRGKTDQFLEVFDIKPDMAPEASIDIAEQYIRSEDSNTAVITVSDASVYDGDQGIREWFVKIGRNGSFVPADQIDGFKDISMGNSSKIEFNKTGVGPFEVKLKVTDRWIEGTLEEFTDSSEIRWSETTAASEVVNVAPYVSLGLSAGLDTDVLIAGDERQHDVIKKDLSALNIAFLENGIDADVHTVISDSDRLDASETDTLTEMFTATGPFGYNGTRTAFEKNMYVIDDQRLYRVDPTWTDPDSGYPQAPYTISAYDAESGETVWQYMFDDSTFDLDYNNAHLYQDDTQQYVYLVSGGNTMIISKSNGQCEAILTFEAGEHNFTGDNSIYTFKSDGIYKMNMSAGTCERIFQANFSGIARRIEGKINAFTLTAKGRVMRILLDPADGSVEQEYVGLFPEDSYVPSGYDNAGGNVVVNTAGIDADGDAVLCCYTSLVDSAGGTKITYLASVRTFDRKNRLLNADVYKSEYPMKVVPVEDRHGDYNYYGVTMAGRDTVTVRVAGIVTDYTGSVMFSDDNGDPCLYENVIYSAEVNGNIEITMGAYCVWIYNDSWASGPRHGYPERCTTAVFNPAAGTAKKKDTMISGCHAFSEYGKTSDLYLAVQTSRNSQYAGSAVVETAVVRRSQSSADMLIKNIKKYLSSSEYKDAGIMLIYGDDYSGEFTEQQAGIIKQMISEKGYLLYVVGSDNENSSSIAEQLGGTYKDLHTDYLNEIAEEVSSKKVKKLSSYVDVSPDGGAIGSELCRDFRLPAGEEYEFELEFYAEEEIADPREVVSVECITDSILGDEPYDEDAYYVTGVVTEDFSDSEQEEFFSYSSYTVSGGLYTDCGIYREGSSNVYRNDTSTITFTVPEGQQGILSFDYRLLRDGSFTNGNYADIDGVRWPLYADDSGGTYVRGNYVHPYILTAGTHTVKLGAGSYGAYLEAYTYIDNLTFSTVSKTAPASCISEIECTSYSDGLYRITGVIKTPARIMKYRALKGVEYIKGAPGKAKYTTYNTSNSNARDLDISIPAGKTSLMTNVQTASSPSGDYAVSYSWTQTGMSWVCRDTINPAQNALNSVPRNWIITMSPVTGAQELKSDFRSYRGTSAEFSNVEMYIADQSNSLVNNNQFICADSSAGRTLYLADGKYNDQSQISLLFAGGARIKNMQISMLDGSKKIHISSDSFADQTELDKWQIVSGSAQYVTVSEEVNGDEIDIPIFEKGELIDYNVIYDDYENDPSRASYWRYIHTPINDGAYEQAAVVMDAKGNIISETGTVLQKPVERFYVDGKYTVEHWQTDDTSRGENQAGNTEYDKDSNIARYTFYVRGEGDNPWIRYIKTEPSKVYEGDAVSIVVDVDDSLKENLNLQMDIYKDGELVCSDFADEIMAGDNGDYTPVRFDNCISSAQCGRYDVHCIVSDDFGTGFDTYSFTVTAKGSLQAAVRHTDKWEENRANYNFFNFEDKYEQKSDVEEYLNSGTDLPRGTNVFWAGEKIIIDAVSEGDPEEVTAWIEGYEDKLFCTLASEGKDTYTGYIWQEDMDDIWQGQPVAAKVFIKSDYGGGNVMLQEEVIIIDSSTMYWRLHKTA